MSYSRVNEAAQSITHDVQGTCRQCNLGIQGADGSLLTEHACTIVAICAAAKGSLESVIPILVGGENLHKNMVFICM